MRRSGSATSSSLGTSLPATLTSEASPMCEPPICAATSSATSSPGSAAGATLSVSPAGPTTDLFGQALAPASPSAAPERARRPMTSATCGLAGFLSSQSYALQSSLESRLKRRLDGAGSTLFSLTWRVKATPAGRPYFPACGIGAPHIRQRCWFVADADSRGCEPGGIARGVAQVSGGEFLAGRPPAQRGAHGSVADNSSERWERREGATQGGEPHWPDAGRQQGHDGLVGVHQAGGGLADAERDGGRSDQPRRQAERREVNGRAGAAADRLGIASGAGLAQQRGDPGVPREAAGAAQGKAPLGTGAWSSSEWLACSDGKARPTQSGLFPLAHGIPGRVGRLRAYGNAIVPQVAAEFVTAFMECRP